MRGRDEMPAAGSLRIATFEGSRFRWGRTPVAMAFESDFDVPMAPIAQVDWCNRGAGGTGVGQARTVGVVFRVSETGPRR